MGAGLGKQGLAGAYGLVGKGVGQPGPEAEGQTGRDGYVHSAHLQGTHIGVHHAAELFVPDGGDTIVHEVVEAGDRGGKVFPVVLGRDIEILTGLGLKVRVAVNHEDAGHVE